MCIRDRSRARKIVTVTRIARIQEIQIPAIMFQAAIQVIQAITYRSLL